MIYTFAEFCLDLEQETLTRNGQSVGLRGNALQVLRLLIERSPALLSKDEILDEIWGHEALSESSIPQVIKDIRKALEDSAKTPRFIVTHYGRGYRFIADVEKQADDSQQNEKPVVPKRQKRRLLHWLGILFIAAMVTYTIWLNMPKPNAPVENSSQPKWLLRAAQTPDDNNLSDAFSRYLDFVIDSAQGSNQIDLIGNNDPVADDARIIDIALAIDANTDQTQGRFMLSISSTDAPTKTPTRTSQPVQDSIAEIFKRVELDHQEKIGDGIVSQSAFAIETLLRGMAALFAGELERAEALFEACLAEDPEFDFARYELAIAVRESGNPDKSLALLQTLESRQFSPFWLLRIHNAKGSVLRELGRLEEAIESFSISIQHAQSVAQRATIATNLALLLRDQGRHAEAAELLSQNLKQVNHSEHKRLAASMLNSLASVYMRMSRLTEAEAALLKASEIFYDIGARGNYAAVTSRIAQLYMRKGQYSEASHYLRTSIDIRQQLGQSPAVAHGKVRLSRLIRALGDFDQARQLANEALALALSLGALSEQQTANASLAATELAAGHYADALIFANRALEAALRRGHPEPALKARLGKIAVELEQSDRPENTQERIDAVMQEANFDHHQYVTHQANLLIAKAELKLGNSQHARALLEQLINATEDDQEIELMVSAMFTLAQSYLPDQPTAAQHWLDALQKMGMTHYPYPILQARTLQARGKVTEALTIALEAKQTAGDWWNAADEAVLRSLQDSQGLNE